MSSKASQGPEFSDHLPLPYRLRPDVTVSQSTDVVDGRKRFYLKTPEGKIFEVGEEEYFFCTRLDGRVSFVELKAAFEAQFDTTLTLNNFTAFAQELMGMGIIQDVSATKENQASVIDRILDPDDPDPRATPFRRTLLDPTAFFAMMGQLRPAFGFLSFITLPIFALGLGVYFNHGEAMGVDFRRAVFDVGVIVLVVLSLFGVNLVSKLVQGTAAYVNGAPVQSLGINVFFGFFPRFYIDHRAIMGLDYKAQRRVFGSAMLTRMFLFGFFAMMWLALRPNAVFLSDLMLLLSHMSLAALIVTALPFFPTDGYRWIAAYIGQPFLRERSFRYLGMVLRGKKAPDEMGAWDKTGALLFSTISLLVVIAVVTLVFGMLAIVLERNLGGAGMGIFAVILMISALWLYFARNASHRMQEKLRQNVQALRDGNQARALPGPEKSKKAGAPVIDIKTRHPQQETTSLPQITPPTRAGWAKPVLIALLVIAFLFLWWPYQYKPGGNFEVLPQERAQVRARIEGEITEIYVQEGDIVEAGAPLAQVTNWQAERNIRVIEAELAQSRAVLDRLLEGSTDEEVELARRQVERAASQLDFRRAELERQQALSADGYTSNRAVELARSEYRSALSDLGVARANLDVVDRDATPSEIAAARADVTRLEQDLSYRQDEVSRTTLRATIGGQVVTPEETLRLGDYLRVGDLFVEIENMQRPKVQVFVSQNEARFLEVGQRVRIRTWGFSDDVTYGTVNSIAPTVDPQRGEQVLRIVASIDEEVPDLPSNMTGYAKIETDTMPLWRAYLLFLIRFFQVEVWSWFP
ncbi:hypothetical protein PB2503_07504 [Parvularcula bermudensis HTCC2503]|uniref:Uncharacterized protein n=1 Tax=Parvularcula bermudensis (strain ATCC BAA-594 / HTCC2503 / KCTC 12087) TaxID=314260 RepID=E0TFF7_PARBH|nr:HlyD family efflux transporter periplasmic adaptor subunit [Parvularcula bermudensis]ADM09558.1 hypothetical protein PB2503_07504 [Parvularcula bermudensis HTCC2503]